MVTNELDNLAILWNKTKDPYYKNLWYKLIEEFANGSNNIQHDSKIETLIDKLVDTDQKFPVVDTKTGKLIGEIDRAIVMKSMKSAS